MKKKALVLAICMACAAPTICSAKALPVDILGLNLGEIQSSSFLGEPFKGIIPILFANKEQASKLNVRLAPNSIYTQLGIDKSPLLNNLTLKISKSKGKPTIVIRSNKAINLPFLNFVLEIEDSRGSIYQDYTVMLDPRGYQQKTKNNSNQQNSLLISSKTSSKILKSKTKNTDNYTIKAGDSLSRIAQKFTNSDISLNKMMEAIHLKNPSAFIENDINRIRKGNVLNLPSSKELNNFDLLEKQTLASKEKNSTKADVVSENVLSDDNTYKVKNGDTLSKITKEFGQEGVSFTKMMKAIHTANPDAFSKNRINILKVNALLKIPSFKKAAINDFKSTTYETNVEQKSNDSSVDKQDAQSNSTSLLKETNTPSAEADVIAIEQLNNANSKIVESLEKRIRELRGQLSSVKKDYSELETSLTKKDGQLLKQKTKVKKLKKTLISIQSNDLAVNKEAEKQATETLEKDLNRQELAPEEANSNINTKIDNIINNEETTSVIVSNVTSKSLEQTLKDAIKAKVEANNNEIFSAKNISYATLLFILGFLLIKYRKGLYTYTPITIHMPKSESLENQQKTKKKSLEYVDTLVSTDEEETVNLTNPVNKLQPRDDSSFSDDNIHECELLVDELLDDLETKPKIYHANNSKEVIFDSVCDQEIEPFEEDELSEPNYLFEENFSEIEIENEEESAVEIFDDLIDITSDNHKSEALESNTSTLQNNNLPDVEPFKQKMDELVASIEKNNKTIESKLPNPEQTDNRVSKFEYEKS